MTNLQRRHNDKSDCFLTVAAWSCIAFMLFIVASIAQAEPMVELGGKIATYNEASTEKAYQLNVGWKEFPVYAFVGYEDQIRFKLLGQPIAETDVLSFGIGARQQWDKFFVGLEAGWAKTDFDVDQRVSDEVVYTHLVGRHLVEGRRIPVEGTRRVDYNTDWRVESDDGFLGRVVIGYQLWEHLAVTASYRWLSLDQEMWLKDDQWSQGEGYWREDDQIDLGAFEAGVWLTW